MIYHLGGFDRSSLNFRWRVFRQFVNSFKRVSEEITEQKIINSLLFNNINFGIDFVSNGSRLESHVNAFGDRVVEYTWYPVK